jgi:hypothetical protein
MRSVVLAVAVAAGLGGVDAGAHRLDEYLQAVRVGVARDRVRVEIDLSPGVSVAPAVVAAVDRDADGRISPLEAHDYAREVVGDIGLRVDGVTIEPAIERVEAPPVGELAAGSGVMQIVATADLVEAAGRHELVLRNDHRPDLGVYLINALQPKDIVLGTPRRDPRQRELHLEYEVSGAASALPWTMAILFGLAALAVYRQPGRFWQRGRFSHILRGGSR